MGLDNLFNLPPYIQILILVWTIFWKVLALWRAAKLDQKYWFVGLFVINSLGILEILYLFVFARKKMKVEDLKPENLLSSKI